MMQFTMDYFLSQIRIQKVSPLSGFCTISRSFVYRPKHHTFARQVKVNSVSFVSLLLGKNLHRNLLADSNCILSLSDASYSCLPRAEEVVNADIHHL